MGNIDIVESLREHAARVSGDGPSGPNYDPETLVLENDAADEIVRLREALRIIIRNVDSGSVHVSWCSQYAKEVLNRN